MKTQTHPTHGERIPPNAPQAERGALGALLHDPPAVLPTWREFMPGDPSAGGLFDPRHQLIFRAVGAMLDAGATVDASTLYTELERTEQTTQAGGFEYLASLLDETPSAATAPHFLRIVREKWLLRQTIAAGTRAVAAAYDSAGPSQVLGEAAVEFEELANLSAGAATETRQIEIATIAELRGYKPDPKLFLIGADTINRAEITVIAGWPGLGKSRLGTTLALAGARGSGDWMGYTVRRQFRTLVLQSENSLRRLKEEVAGVPKAAEEWVRFSKPTALRFGDPAFRAELRRIFQLWPFDVVILDHWAEIAREEGQADHLEAMENVLSCFPRGEASPAVVFIAHLRKQRGGDSWRPKTGRELLNELSGSFVIGAKARAVFVLQPGSMDIDDDRLVFECAKSNNDKPLPPSAWHRRNGEFLACPDFDFDEWHNPPENGRRGITEADMDAVFQGGRRALAKKHATAELKAAGFSQATAYRALDTEAGKFKDRLTVKGELLTWSAEP